MSHRTLSSARTAWRIGDSKGEFLIWDDGGARRTPGRWHEAGAGVIYALFSYSTAMLEKLVRCSGVLPPNQHFSDVIIPAGTTYEVFSETHYPKWFDRGGEASRAFGMAWYEEGSLGRSHSSQRCRPNGTDAVFNTNHKDFTGITPGLETPVWWDYRLFTPT